MSKTPKTQDQKAQENVIVITFAAFAFFAAVVMGLATQPAHQAHAHAHQPVEIGTAVTVTR